MEMSKHFSQISSSKKDLRQHIRSVKNGLSLDDKKMAGKSVFQALEQTPEFQKSQTILLYWSMPDELPTQDFIEKWSNVKKILLPKIVDNELIVVEYINLSDMTNGNYGILEPNHCNQYQGKIDIGCIPGIAFDTKGHRLGRGKGYYDRLLLQIECIKIGVGFDVQLVDEVPVFQQDINMDIIITPTKCIRCTENISTYEECSF
jgi:5-formyltetrahydrofolate cyclo-ligase